MSREWIPQPPALACALALLAAFGADPARSQSIGGVAPGEYDHAAAPSLAAGRAGWPIAIDGRLDEPAWKGAPVATGFTQRDPDEREPASERTEVRILLGDDAIYVGARMRDREPAGIVTRMARSGAPPDFDWFLVYFDPFHDHTRSVWFSLNPSGVETEAVLTDRGVHDLTWDPVWDGEARIDDAGWVAEMRIPLSQIRFDPERETWGLQLMRGIQRKQELVWWAFTPKSHPEGPSRFGHLTGLEALPGARSVEVAPYGSVRSERRAEISGEHRLDPRAGLDLKVRPHAAVTIDATVNPDFGQVEVDPAVVNLTAFETFFPERRPFFVEGASIFEFARLAAHNVGFDHAVFYSRRIGRPPQGTLVDAGDAEDLPDETTIAAAAKLTARTASGWSIGLLDAWTLAERVSVAGEADPVTVEPPVNYAVARIRKDLRGGESAIGAIATRVDRRFDETGIVDLLPRNATVVGVDVEHAWSNRAWVASGFAARSRVSGAAAAVAEVQRSSARYLQRPDAAHLTFDPTRTSLEGYTWQVALQRASGDHWTGSVAWQEASPGYETNDAGFLSITDRRSLAWLVRYRDEEPGRRVRRWDLALSGNHDWSFGGDPVGDMVGLSGSVTLPDFQTIGVGAWRRFARDHDRLTRGGPLARYPAAWGAHAGFASDPRRSGTWRIEAAVARDAAGGYTASSSGRVVVRPSAAARIEVGPRIERVRDVAQYVAAVDDPTADRTFGTRYVFAPLDQTTVSTDARVRWGFTPELSLEAYGQLLVAGNEFGPLEEFREPGAFAFDAYGRDRGTVEREGGEIRVDPDGPGGEAPAFAIDDPDFGTGSLRGNVVLRWEFRPGSTLYAVYQHGRERIDGTADLELGRDLDLLFDQSASHVFLVKASWWIDL